MRSWTVQKILFENVTASEDSVRGVDEAPEPKHVQESSGQPSRHPSLPNRRGKGREDIRVASTQRGLSDPAGSAAAAGHGITRS
nr:hypothetical protein GCM10017611_33860 [Rhodococcus wratislaviensis]